MFFYVFLWGLFSEKIKEKSEKKMKAFAFLQKPFIVLSILSVKFILGSLRERAVTEGD